jgi:formylglycine-generating enzyme required for sulfatase activity
MSGNVAEWENSCNGTTGQTDNCAVRGGAYDTTPGQASLTCASSSARMPVTRQTPAADIGFRCCL